MSTVIAMPSLSLMTAIAGAEFTLQMAAGLHANIGRPTPTACRRTRVGEGVPRLQPAGEEWERAQWASHAYSLQEKER